MYARQVEEVGCSGAWKAILLTVLEEEGTYINKEPHHDQGYVRNR